MSKRDSTSHQIQIPKNSYTAFRLRYCSALELYNTSTVVFLGNFPPAWILDKKSVLLAKIYRLDNVKSHEIKNIERKTLDRFEDAVPTKLSKGTHGLTPNIVSDHLSIKERITSKILNKITTDNEKSASGLSEERVHDFLQKTAETDYPNLLNFKCPRANGKLTLKNNDSFSEKNESTSTFDIPRQHFQKENIKFHHRFNSAMYSSGSGSGPDSGSDQDSDPDSFNDNHKSNSETNIPTNINLRSTSTQLDEFLKKPVIERQQILRNEINNVMLSLQKTVDSEISMNKSDNESYASYTTASEIPLDTVNTSNDTGLEPTKYKKVVAFSSIQERAYPKSLSNESHVFPEKTLKKQAPIPFFESQPIYALLSDEGDLKPNLDYSFDKSYFIIDDDENDKYNYLKTKTLGAKLGLSEKQETKSRKKKVEKILQHFQTGEIIKMEKMLVTVSLTDNITLNSESKKSARILERWKEYIAVVRATDDTDYPAIIQFYKTNKIFKRDDTLNVKNEIYKGAVERERTRDANMNGFEFENTKEVVIQNLNEGDDDDDNNATLSIDDSHNLTLQRTITNVLGKEKPIKNTLKKTKSCLDENKNFKTSSKEMAENLYKSSKGEGCHFSLVLSRLDTHISFANLLDKSIRISKEKKSCKIEYTLLAHSTTSAIIWLSFLRQLLIPKSLNQCKQATMLITIPDLNISFTILGAKSLFYSLVKENTTGSDYIMVKFRNDGYQFPKLGSFEKLLDMISKQIDKLEKNNKIPEDQETKRFVSKIKNDRTFLALTFRKYDRLEWILGENESLLEILWNLFGSSYELELREFQHEAHVLSDNSLIEPLPIEGFVVKLSNRKGSLKSTLGRQYYKLLYAFTVENLLFFQKFYNAVPVIPSNDLSQRNLISPAGDVLNLKQLEKSSSFKPQVYRSVVYPLTEHHIEWLNPNTTPEEYYEKDLNALYEAERRACMISNAHAVIDLCKISDIRLVPKKDISVIVKRLNITTWGHLKKDYESSTFTADKELGSNEDENNDEYVENCLDLKFVDGSSLRLQLCTKSIRNAWAKNLGKLSEYWILKRKEDLDRHILLKERNLSLMNSNDENYESLVAKESETSCSKWELSKAYTDSQFYSISSYALDKPVLMEGYIYCKKFKSKQYQTFYAVLSPGFLILYEIFNRSKTSRVARPSTYYVKYATISLTSCYVFSSSGKIHPENHNPIFFNSSSYLHCLPRIYADGWRSSESMNERSFTLWFGSKSIMMKNIKKTKGSELNSERHGGKFKVSSKDNSDIQTSCDFDSTPSEDDESESETEGEDEVGVNTDRTKKGKFHFTRLKKVNHKKKTKVNQIPEINNYYGDSEHSFTSDDESSSESDVENIAAVDYESDRNMLDFSKLSMTNKASAIGVLKTITRLGVSGRALAFLARSRVERDLWVTRLMTEVERFSESRNNDIQLV